MYLNNEISVIVPVYNCEKYIGKCIESVINQTYTYWRLILVDDGSPDGAGAICDRYAALDSRIMVIHQSNGGPGKARNNGILHCCTRWFTFLDSDDVLEPCYLENFHPERLVRNCQLSIQGFKRVDMNGKILDEVVDFKTAVYRGKHEIVDAFINNDIFMYGQSCGKLYNKPLIEEAGIMLSTDIKLSEDHLFYLQYLLHVSEIFTYSGTKYCYQMADAEQSLTHRVIPWSETLTRFHLLYKASEDVIKHYNIKSKQLLYKIYYFSVTGGISLTLNSLYSGDNNPIKRKEVLGILADDMKECGCKYHPNGVKGKIFKLILLYAPGEIQDFLLKLAIRK